MSSNWNRDLPNKINNFIFKSSLPNIERTGFSGSKLSDKPEKILNYKEYIFAHVPTHLGRGMPKYDIFIYHPKEKRWRFMESGRLNKKDLPRLSSNAQSKLRY